MVGTSLIPVEAEEFESETSLDYIASPRYPGVHSEI